MSYFILLDPDQTASIHLVDPIITEHSEIDLILEGEGDLELDGEQVPVEPLDAVMIKPGCCHRAVGDLRILNKPIPAVDPKNE